MGRALLGEMAEDEARRVLAASTIKPYTKKTITEPEALLEEFRKARRQGYALIDQELEDGLVAVSVPLRDSAGKVLAAANVCGHSSHLSTADLEKRCLPALQDCVGRIARSLV